MMEASAIRRPSTLGYSIHGKETSGIFKDTVLIKGFSRVDVDFVADNPGLTLFHCHQNLHMDFGFMRLFEYV
jgi:FtsP/CotA-like multicopper oxidase with cupredoxin domain